MAKSKEEYAVSGTTEVKGMNNEILFGIKINKFLFWLIAPLVCSLRLLLAFLAFFGFFLCYAQRNGLAYVSKMKKKNEFL